VTRPATFTLNAASGHYTGLWAGYFGLSPSTTELTDSRGTANAGLIGTPSMVDDATLGRKVLPLSTSQIARIPVAAYNATMAAQPDRSTFAVGLWYKGTATNNLYFASQWSNTDGAERVWRILRSPTGNGWNVVIDPVGNNSGSQTKDYKASTTVNDNAWHHLMFTFASSTLRLFTDGIENTVAGGTLTKSIDNAVSAVKASVQSIGLNCINAYKTPATHAGGSYGDWVIYSGSVPTDANIAKLADAANFNLLDSSDVPLIPTGQPSRLRQLQSIPYASGRL
jgi:hypothetical protein